MKSMYDRYCNDYNTSYTHDCLSVPFSPTLSNTSDILSIKPKPALVKATIEFPQSHTLNDLQSFLGLANYYQKFIKNYSKISLLLTDALQNASNSRSIFTNAMIQAFNDLKTALTNDPCLQLPDLNDEYEVTADASEDEVTVGAVLTQYRHHITFEGNSIPISEIIQYITKKCALQCTPSIAGDPFSLNDTLKFTPTIDLLYISRYNQT
jgi:RNase H-like domain found in reverse transcriptase